MNKQKNRYKLKIYKRSRLQRTMYENGTSFVTDIEGNFNLMCGHPRALRLIDFVKRRRRPC